MKVFIDLWRNINKISKKEEKNKVDTIFQRCFKENKKEIFFSEKMKNYFSTKNQYLQKKHI